MVEHFRLNRYHRDGFTWKQYRNGELITSRCDAILSDCRRDYLNVQIRSPRGMLSDHEALCAWIRAGPATVHKGYLRARKTLLWSPPAQPDKEDFRFDRLKEAAAKPERSFRERKGWISDETWQLVDERAELRR